MRGVFIRDAYIPKLGRVHIFQDTESTTHFHYLAINSDRSGRVRRSDTVFIKEKNASQSAQEQGTDRPASAMVRGHADEVSGGPGS